MVRDATYLPQVTMNWPHWQNWPAVASSHSWVQLAESNSTSILDFEVIVSLRYVYVKKFNICSRGSLVTLIVNGEGCPRNHGKP
jgi:hypothetical protein